MPVRDSVQSSLSEVKFRLLLQQLMNGGLDSIGINSLMAHLLPQTARTFTMRANVVVTPLEALLQKLSAKPRTQSGINIERFGHQHHRSRSQLRHHGVIVNVQSSLVDQADMQPLSLQLDHGIQVHCETV